MNSKIGWSMGSGILERSEIEFVGKLQGIQTNSKTRMPMSAAAALSQALGKLKLLENFNEFQRIRKHM